MHGLHCSAVCKTCVTAGCSLWVTEPAELFPFQPKRIPFLQHLIEISPSTLLFLKSERLFHSECFGG